MSASHATAMQRMLTSCHSCHQLIRLPAVHARVRVSCPRCGSLLYPRKRNSVARTWALVIAACVFYIPANLLPIMEVTSFGAVQADTIMSGVIYFVQSGEWPIALVIFTASILIPILKLLVLILLLISVQRRSRWRPRDRTRLYRVTETMGRWSMVDVYVVTIMVALVRLGPLANVQAGPGALYFTAVVVITMFAAMTFDSRLIWDAMEQASGAES